jgi:hypothetical protein
MALLTLRATSFSWGVMGQKRKNSNCINPRVRWDEIVLLEP